MLFFVVCAVGYTYFDTSSAFWPPPTPGYFW